MQIKCRSCQQPISAQNVNVQSMIAKCELCNAVFGISPQEFHTARLGAPNFSGPNPGVQNVGSPGFGGPGFGGFTPVERGNVPMPPGIGVEIEGKDLIIRRSWWTWAAIFLLFFSIFWNGFIFVFLAIGTGFGVVAFKDFGALGLLGLLFLFIPLLFLGIGICMAYFTLCCFFNTTTIRVDHAELSVAHGPLPWWGNLTLPRSEVAQLFCVERVHHGKRGSVSFTYDVEIVLRDNNRQSLVNGLTEIGQAMFIEQQIERHLNIQDAPVAGEIRRW